MPCHEALAPRPVSVRNTLRAFGGGGAALDLSFWGRLWGWGWGWGWDVWSSNKDLMTPGPPR